MKSLTRKLITIAVFGFILISISSCIGTDSTISINDDGSGVIRLSYTISKLIAHLGKLEETDTSIPLPVGREDFNRTVQRIPGLGFKNYKETEDEENIIINADLTFDSITSLNEFLKGNGGDVIRLVQDGTASLLVFTIYPGRDDDLSERNVEVLSDMFKGYTLNFTVEAPESIREYNLGTQSDDGKSVYLQLPISQLLADNESVAWEISW